MHASKDPYHLLVKGGFISISYSNIERFNNSLFEMEFLTILIDTDITYWNKADRNGIFVSFEF